MHTMNVERILGDIEEFRDYAKGGNNSQTEYLRGYWFGVYIGASVSLDLIKEGIKNEI